MASASAFLPLILLLAVARWGKARPARAEEVKEVRELGGDGEVEAAPPGHEAHSIRLARDRKVVADAEAQIRHGPETQLRAIDGARRGGRGLDEKTRFASPVKPGGEAILHAPLRQIGERRGVGQPRLTVGVKAQREATIKLKLRCR